MIDELRHDLQARLDELLDEADRLGKALAALGGPQPNGSRRPRSTSRRSARNAPRTPTPAQTAPRATRQRTSNGGRARSGGTKSSVLKALASGKAMTASDVASATGLGRASVSTTLSKLAKAGEIRKATRGYELTR